jgi:16S rRNA (guanine(966)-N(2))-methyltransferase RsmD
MRIISGKNKGQRISFPKNLPVRPTTDMAKEGLFNIISNNYNFEDISVIDLFAGSGNISYEFYSRGVQKVLAIDNNSKCTSFIIKQSKSLKMNISVVKRNVYKFLENNRVNADIFFADPPYSIDIQKLNSIIELVVNSEMLNDQGVLIIEHFKKINFSDHKRIVDSRTYGDSSFSFFK